MKYLLIPLMALILSGCLNSDSPESVIVDYYTALSEGDLAKADSFIAKSVKTQSFNRFTVMEWFAKESVNNDGLKGVDIIKAEPHEGVVEASVQLVFNNQQRKHVKTRLIDENGTWRIVLPRPSNK